MSASDAIVIFKLRTVNGETATGHVIEANSNFIWIMRMDSDDAPQTFEWNEIESLERVR